MPRRALIALALSTVVACGGDDSPDNSDAPTASDGPPTSDGSGPDAMTACGADLCLNIVPTDATTPPPGRLAVAWVDFEIVENPPEIAYDVPWAADQVTGVPMSAFAAASPAYQFDLGTNGGPCPGVMAAVAIVRASTDPDGNGAISPDELTATDESIYGAMYGTIAYASATCPPDPDYPDGILAGVHVYSITSPYYLLDGTLVEFRTCMPGAAACNDIDQP